MQNETAECLHSMLAAYYVYTMIIDSESIVPEIIIQVWLCIFHSCLLSLHELLLAYSTGTNPNVMPFSYDVDPRLSKDLLSLIPNRWGNYIYYKRGGC